MSILPATQKLLLKLYAQEILDDVVIEPRGLTVVDFQTVAELGELVRAFKSFRKGMATRGPSERRPEKEGHKAAS